MRKCYVLTGEFIVNNEIIKKVIGVYSSNKKAEHTKKIAQQFYSKVEIITEIIM